MTMTGAFEADAPEGHDEVVSRGPCPNCDTKRRHVTYADGHSYCFKCGHREGASKGKSSEVRPAKVVVEGGVDPLPGSRAYPDLNARGGIKSSTLRKYGYFVGGYRGSEVQVAQFYSDPSTVAWQKVRLPDKQFPQVRIDAAAPPLVDCWLFGRQVYGDRYDRRVIITEGELDCLSVAQVLDFRVAVVSVNGGAQSAARNLKANYLWLDRFEEIILWFDDDEPGKQAAEECAKLFKVGKVRIARVAGYKDASEVLQAGKPGDIESAVYTATAWRPRGIVNAADNADDVKAPKEDEDNGWSYQWPWPKVNEMLGPIKGGQVTYHVAGTGIGKSTGVAEIAYSLVKQGARIAWMGFEDTRRDTKLRLLSIHVSDRLDIAPRPDDEMVALHQDLFAPGSVWLFDPETAEWSVDAILGYVRYCAKALDCRIIFIDPLSFIVAGLESGDDERRALDRVSRDLAALSKELGVHLQITHHLKRPEGTAHEEGAATSLNQVRGSGGIANFATFVIGHERNQQAEGESSLITQLRTLKNRPRSRTGVVIALKYSLMTGRLLPTDEEFPQSTRRGRSFGPIAPQPSGDRDY